MKVRVPKDAGGPSLSSLKKMQKIQEEMEQKQQELAERVFEASSGGGAVTASVTGAHRVSVIRIDPDVVDPDDMETLEDLVCAAVNEAMETADKTTEEEMGKITGSLGIPGLM